MYELYKLNDDLYQIHSTFRGEQSMEGTLTGIITYASRTLGFKIEELECALLDMLNRDTDAAHFGINRIFIFSFNRSERKTG
jgi:hypothetical protein